jgi:uncharacterized membrane protein YvbJ
MALIECLECHKQVSEKAASCPNCGAPVTAVTEQAASAETAAAPEVAVTPNSMKSRRRDSIVLGMIVFFAVGGYFALTSYRQQSFRQCRLKCNSARH